MDCFAGPGSDREGQPGSPKILLDILQASQEAAFQKRVPVVAVFNEANSKKYQKLKILVESFHLPKSCFQVETRNKPFAELAPGVNSYLKEKGGASFLFIDQFGVKEVTRVIFQKLVEIQACDFMFFVSSFHYRRFIKHSTFQELGLLTSEEVEDIKPQHVHRKMAEGYRRWLPKTSRGSRYYVIPFSIKKNSSIHGLVFCSGDPMGAETFLKAAWKEDPETGEANYDIDNDQIREGQLTLFGGMQKPKKLDMFEQELKDRILNGEIKTLQEAYLFTIETGCLPKHGKQVFTSLFEMGKLADRITQIEYGLLKEKPIPIRLTEKHVKD